MQKLNASKKLIVLTMSAFIPAAVLSEEVDQFVSTAYFNRILAFSEFNNFTAVPHL